MLASDISFKHVGKTFRSLVYRDKNKTSTPIKTRVIIDGGEIYAVRPREWSLSSLHFYDNGNIFVNQGQYYLRPDTEVVVIDDI